MQATQISHHCAEVSHFGESSAAQYASGEALNFA
jgi:hypothetical protein